MREGGMKKKMREGGRRWREGKVREGGGRKGRREGGAEGRRESTGMGGREEVGERRERRRKLGHLGGGSEGLFGKRRRKVDSRCALH